MQNRILLGLFAATLALLTQGCSVSTPVPTPQSSSGVSQARVTVPTGSDGLTAEQRNVQKRLKIDNMPGSIKHFYAISPFSGDVLIYSTVQGKVTSSGKRLSPRTVTTASAFEVRIGDKDTYTTEVLEDDGTYGDSVPYIYWFDTQNRYHQHYPTGGQIIHVTDQPLVIPKVTINMELVKERGTLPEDSNK